MAHRVLPGMPLGEYRAEEFLGDWELCDHEGNSFNVTVAVEN